MLRAGSFSCLDVTKEFEADIAAYYGRAHALAYPNGTMALLAAFFAVGVARGDVIVCPSITFWASVAQAQAALGARVRFCDVDPATFCVDAGDLARVLAEEGGKVAAVVVVHYAGHVRQPGHHHPS